VVLNWIVVDSFHVSFMTTIRESDATWEPFYNAIGELVTETSGDRTDTDYTATLGWYPKIPSGALDVRVEYIFNENNSELDPGVIDPSIPGFGVDRKELNARVAWTSDDEQWTAALWGKNLTDQKRLGDISDITLFSFGTPFTSINAPLTWGVEVGYRF